jgi:acetolactate decarboxylase
MLKTFHDGGNSGLPVGRRRFCDYLRAAALAALLLLASSVAARASEGAWQYSTIAALMAGAYQGELTAGELKRRGDLGLGTFNALDGEMIVLDGQVWQVLASGTPAEATDSLDVPFAVVTRFAPRKKVELPTGLDMAGLAALLDSRIGDLGLIQAVRIDGHFAQLKVRSVRAQTPPYRPLTEVLARDQIVFDLANAEGTLVGFRFPANFSGVNVPEWHLHFLSADRRTGGHVLGLVTGPAHAELDPMTSLEIDFLPDGRNGAVEGLPDDAALRAAE